MPPTVNKQQALTTTLTVLKKHYEPPEPDKKPVLEQLLYGVLREGATRDQADAAYRNLTERFYDWNEVRVSSPAEVGSALDSLPSANAKAPKVVGILQEVFEKNFSFNMDEIDKKGLKNAARELGRMQDVTGFAAAWVMQQALGGHALPLDGPTLRVLTRLGVAEPDGDDESLRTTLEHYVPKAKGPLFNEVMSLVARDFCWEEEPHCSACPMAKECPTGQERRHAELRPRLRPR
ncbi:MAG: endonuclease III domain-containing protein [Gemmataceae bacterium]